MRLNFTKGAGKWDWLEVIREDGSRETIDNPKQGLIPHDMVHFAVESVVRERGFLTLVAQGGAATMAAGTRLAEAEPVERLVEVIQADAWSAPSTAEELVRAYEHCCWSRGHDAPPISPAAIEAIRDRIVELHLSWSALGVGETLALELPPPGVDSAHPRA